MYGEKAIYFIKSEIGFWIDTAVWSDKRRKQEMALLR